MAFTWWSAPSGLDADTVTPQLRAQLPATLALRCVTDTNSRLLLDGSAAADLAPRPGRAIWQWDWEVEVQLPKLEKAEARALLAARYTSAQGDASSPGRKPAELRPGAGVGVEGRAHAA